MIANKANEHEKNGTMERVFGCQRVRERERASQGAKVKNEAPAMCLVYTLIQCERHISFDHFKWATTSLSSSSVNIKIMITPPKKRKEQEERTENRRTQWIYTDTRQTGIRIRNRAIKVSKELIFNSH